jgi:hypothetical protein
MLVVASNAKCAPRCGVLAAGVDPPNRKASGRGLVAQSQAPADRTIRRRTAAMPHSERCCGIPARRARTSVSRYRRCPPSVRIDVSFPAFAHLVTVFGSTLNIVATSAGVSSGSASGVRADMLTASPPGPSTAIPTYFSYRSWLLVKPALDVPYSPLRPYCHHQP